MDNCLYPESSGLCNEMNKRISSFTAELLSVSFEEAVALRKKNVKTFGTTLKWLESTRGFTAIDEYNRVIHPANVEDFLKPSRNLKKMLNDLSCRLSVLTNAPAMHAERVLGYLDISSCFENILDLGFCDTMGKPHKHTFEKALEVCGYEINHTLFLDDVPEYLTPFREMGGEVLLVDESGRHTDKNIPSITNILQLPEFLEAPVC